MTRGVVSLNEQKQSGIIRSKDGSAYIVVSGIVNKLNYVEYPDIQVPYLCLFKPDVLVF